ncbi:MAG TPA: hypothetical protein VI032_20785 [Burkholderiaceae bacterium]
MSPTPERGRRCVHAARSALLLAAGLWVGACAAADSLLADLDQRLSRSGIEAVNSYLGAHWASAMVPLNRKTAACELHAVGLSVKLSRGRDARAVQAHGEALRAAAGGCPRFVLAMVTPAEVPRYCASVASWGAAQTARELRRRIADIEADEQLRGSRRGQACRAAYVYELENTRVVVKRTAPSARAAGK